MILRVWCNPVSAGQAVACRSPGSGSDYILSCRSTTLLDGEQAISCGKASDRTPCSNIRLCCRLLRLQARSVDRRRELQPMVQRPSRQESRRSSLQEVEEHRVTGAVPSCLSAQGWPTVRIAEGFEGECGGKSKKGGGYGGWVQHIPANWETVYVKKMERLLTICSSSYNFRVEN